MSARLPLLAPLAAVVLSTYAKYTPRFLAKGKIYRAIARLCDGCVVTSRYGVRMHVNYRDRTNQYAILGNYDAVAAEVGALEPGMCFFDIGANAGLFALLASSRVGPEGLVIAFEPCPEQYALLVKNLEANGCTNVLPMMLAVADVTGHLAFACDNHGHSGRNRIPRPEDQHRTIRVAGVNLSEDFAALGKLVGDRRMMVKIDVEGYEHRVLKSIVSVLRGPSTQRVIVEIDDHALRHYGSSREDINRLMAELGFAPQIAAPAERHFDQVFVRWAAGAPAGIGARGHARDARRPARTEARRAAWPVPGSKRAQPRPHMRTVGRVAAAALVAFVAAGGFVALVDPYGVTGLVKVSRINLEKTQRMDGGGRVERSLRLWLADHETLILGGARARVGLDPAGPMLAELKAYNAAMPAATMNEIYALGRFALAHERAKRVILALSFSMFEADRTTSGDFEGSGLDGHWMPTVYARSLLTPSAVFDALHTVYDNLQGRQAWDRADGFHRMPVGPDYDYRKAFRDILAEEYLVRPWHYADFDYDPGRIRLLADLLRRFAAADVETHLFVSPVHARQLEAIAATGLYHVYERWLRDLTTAVAEANASIATDQPITLWDFSGYNSVTTEDVPDPGDLERWMTWYWDSAHYTSWAGDLVLARMLGTKGAAIVPPADFGVRLDRTTIDAALAAKRVARTVYASRHPEEVNDVGVLVRTAAHTLESSTPRR